MNVTLFGSMLGETRSFIDSNGILSHLLFKVADLDYEWLKYIDPYDDTVFNSLQMKPVLSEWKRMIATVCDEREAHEARAVENFLVQCSENVGYYIKFVGD